jgi:hypothetical protein
MRRIVVCMSLCVAITVAMALGYSVAQAYCIQHISAATQSASLDCYLTGSDAEWCYYDCECLGDSSECDRMEWELELEPY